ncbi:MAG: HDIG domain-containing protein [candidate division Zixibacteria bacterium]|nr:HDIG domain-containing protein [candidate division Zixibacteria bacterium]
MAAALSQQSAWLADLLAAGEVYEVGGSVRDRLLAGSESSPAAHKDRDYLVRRIPIDRMQQILRRHGAVNLVGRSFGVVKFTPDDEAGVTHDIALPRAERSTGVGHTDFAVDFDPELPVETDLRRRDFTINALAANCATGEVVDPLNGRDDLQRRILRMAFPDAFREDALRILRGAQFAARFSLTVEPQTHAAMCEAAPLVESLSMERVAEELTKLLTLAPKPSVGFKILQEVGVLRHLLPELEATVGVDQPGGYHAHNVFEHSLYTVDAAAPRLNLRWACLLHDVNKPQCKEVTEDKATFYGHDKMGSRTARRILQRLRYPNELCDQVELLVDKHMFTTGVTDKGVRRLIRRLGTDLVFDLLDLRRADVVAQGMGGHTDDVDLLQRRIEEEINRKSPFGIKDLAINGRDLQTELGMSPGPAIGRVLSALLEAVLDDPSSNTRDALLGIARKLLMDSA